MPFEKPFEGVGAATGVLVWLDAPMPMRPIPIPEPVLAPVSTPAPMPPIPNIIGCCMPVCRGCAGNCGCEVVVLGPNKLARSSKGGCDWLDDCTGAVDGVSSKSINESFCAAAVTSGGIGFAAAVKSPFLYDSYRLSTELIWSLISRNVLSDSGSSVSAFEIQPCILGRAAVRIEATC